LGKDRDNVLVYKRKLPEEHAQTIKKYGQYTIAYTLAYAQFCEWLNSSKKDFTPRGEDLTLAEAHAQRLGDDFILEQIEEVRAYWENRDSIATPKAPKPSEEAIQSYENLISGRTSKL
jgi:hypothetical protein